MSEAKKLVSVWATSSSETETSKEDDVPLQRVLYIYYPIRFKMKKVQTLIDLGNEVNTMTPAYASRLGLRVHCINIGAQRIDGSMLETFEMVLARFQWEDKFGKIRFFQETFLLADISTEVVLGIPFLTLSNANV